MKALFAKKAANSNIPKENPIDHIHSGKQEALSVDFGELFGLDDDGMPKTDIHSLEWDEPHSVYFQADSQIGGNSDKYRIYANFDKPGDTPGQRAVLIAHNISKADVEKAFESWDKDALGTPKIVEAHMGYACDLFIDGPDQP